MNTFFLAQIFGAFTILLTSMSFYQKEKWKMMLFLSASNLTMLLTYPLLGSWLGCFLVLGALIRTLVYFYYSKTNRKPEPIVMILFEIYYIVISIIKWNSVTDLLMIINLVVVTYTTWQDDLRTLRFGYIFSSCLLLIYDLALGAYTTAISEVFMLINVVFSLIKFSKATKSSQNIAQKYFKANEFFWGSHVISHDTYDMILSNTVDASPFYNFGIVKALDDLKKMIEDIKSECKKSNVKEVAYIPFDAKKFDQFESNAHTLNMFFPIEFNDVWMKLIDGFNLNNTRCKISNIKYKICKTEDINDVIEVYLKGYHAKSDITDLDPNEKMQVDNLKNIKFNEEYQNGYTINAYLAYYNENPISLVVTLSNNIEAYITKVSTLPIFRRKHVASSLIQFGIKDLREKGVEDIILVTDKYSTNEKFYEFNSFVEFGQAFALDVTSTKKYYDFIENNFLG